MYVIAVEPNKKAHTRIIDDDLNALQKAVGGNIETIYLNDDPIVIVCNSERKLNGKKMNHALTNDNGEIYDILSGTFLVAGVNSNGELTSIPGELVEKYLDRYEILHVFAKGDDGRYTVAELPAKVGDDINESLEIYEEDRAAYIEEMGEEPSEYQHVIWSNSLNVDPELWRGSFNDYIALNNLELDPDNKSELFRYIPHHQYTDGETVYIGAEEYVITSISDNSVVVAQANAPLFTTTYNKEEFEQKLLENPLNSKYLCETDTLSLAAADEPDADVDLDSDDVEEAKEVSESKTITDDFAEYENVKRNYPESYVLYQVGDFYEAYREDAQEVAQMLDLRVTNHLVRDDLRVSMCGFPVHALEQYTTLYAICNLRRQYRSS